MSIKTQGTEFWAVNPITKTLINLGCVTSIDGIDSSIAEIETTCLSSLAREYEGGLAEPGTASFEIQFDPDNPDHILLQKLKTAGVTLDWFVGFRYEVAGEPVVPGPAPTVDNTTGEVELPEERAWIMFSGFMNSFPFGFNQNDVVRSGITVRISGDPEVVPKVTTP